MNIFVDYKDIEKKYKNEIKRCIEQIRASRSKYKHCAPEDLKWKFWLVFGFNNKGVGNVESHANTRAFLRCSGDKRSGVYTTELTHIPEEITEKIKR